MNGVFKGWIPSRSFGFIVPEDGGPDVFLHRDHVAPPNDLRTGDRVAFEVNLTFRGRSATSAVVVARAAIRANDGGQRSGLDEAMTLDDIEDLDVSTVEEAVLAEIANWKREAKAEDNDRYFWHVREVDQIAKGEKYFVIGRKGSGKTAICEYFNRLNQHDIFTEKLSFKQFPFNELYSRPNEQYTTPNQYITIWKYLIYSTVCRLMLKNQALDLSLRNQLDSLFGDRTSLPRRVGRWVGQEFGISLFGVSVKLSNRPLSTKPEKWADYVNIVEDLLLNYAGEATYFVLFDELDEDYRDVVYANQYKQYTALITSLFKAVQDIRTTFSPEVGIRIYPVIFLRDDIYEIVQDSDKNKWGDFRVDLNWDLEKIKKLVAFRISRALDSECQAILPFDSAWSKVFGKKLIEIGSNRKRISTFEYIARSTLLRPRDFVAYL